MPISSRTLAGVVVILLAAFAADAARAQTVAETIAKWGLLGTWATDCSRPPGRTNGYLAYVAGGAGRVLYARNFGNQRDVREIRAAAVRPGGLLEVVADFGAVGGVRRWAIAKGADGRIRTMANSKIDGTDASVRNGRLVRSGAETVWQSKCQRPPPKTLREAGALQPNAPSL
jgi:hypothetical protein